MIDPTRHGYPCRFDKMGIALRAQTAGEVVALLDALTSRGTIALDLESARTQYFEANPQLQEKSGLTALFDRLSHGNYHPAAIPGIDS